MWPLSEPVHSVTVYPLHVRKYHIPFEVECLACIDCFRKQSCTAIPLSSPTHVSVRRRNQNYHDILKGLGSLKQARQISTFDLTYQFHHLFFFGDLNYRIDLPATRIVQLARDKDYEELMKEEQLCKEKKYGKVFVGFRESSSTVVTDPVFDLMLLDMTLL